MDDKKVNQRRYLSVFLLSESGWFKCKLRTTFEQRAVFNESIWYFKRAVHFAYNALSFSNISLKLNLHLSRYYIW